MGHTKGPWTVKLYMTPDEESDPLGVYVVNEAKAELEAIDNLPIGEESDESQEEKMWAIERANGQLISAAPELLEALHHVKNCVEGHDEWWIGEFYNEIKAAIAKAEGKE